MHRPSPDQLWQIPIAAWAALPNPPGVFFRLLPDEAQETSYLAAAARIRSFSGRSILSPPRTYVPLNYNTSACPGQQIELSYTGISAACCLERMVFLFKLWVVSIRRTVPVCILIT